MPGSPVDGWMRGEGLRGGCSSLGKVLLSRSQPCVAQDAAAEALGQLGGRASIKVLKQVESSRWTSVVQAAVTALESLIETEQDIQS